MLSSKSLLSVLDVAVSDKQSFHGTNVFMGSPNVFGGQFVAQALNAAYKTVSEDQLCNSLHCYFLLPGNLKYPIDYQIDTLRDGNSFAVRLVKAFQKDVLLFTMMVSFQREERGFIHQITMPNVPEPEYLDDILELPDIDDKKVLEDMRKFLQTDKPIEMRVCPSDDSVLKNRRRVWFRFKDVDKSITSAEAQQLITYASDYNILATALLVHGHVANFSNTLVASLDHDIRFYYPSQYDDWLLYDLESPIALNARAFASGNIFNRNGQLVAVVSQEGLMRPIHGLINI